MATHSLDSDETYTNALVLTSIDPRGLVVTNAWDALRLPTGISIPDGTVTLQYTNLDLRLTISPSAVISYRWL